MLEEKKRNPNQPPMNEASINNYSDILDFNSRLSLLYHEESMNISQFGYNMIPANQNSRNFSHIENNENTFTLHLFQNSKRHFPLEDHSIKRQYEMEDEGYSFDNPPARINASTKGLKSLAWNIHKSLKRRNFSSADQLSQAVENCLKVRRNKEKVDFRQEFEDLEEKSRKKKKDVGRQSIRRRIYDALNVMIAVGLVTKKKERISIQSVFNENPIKQISFRDNNQTFNDFQTKLAEKNKRINWKKEIIQEKKKQIKLFEILMKKNQRQNENEELEKISFPFVIFHFPQSQQQATLIKKNSVLMKVNKYETNICGEMNSLDFFIDEDEIEVKKLLDMQDICQ